MIVLFEQFPDALGLPNTSIRSPENAAAIGIDWSSWRLRFCNC